MPLQFLDESGDMFRRLGPNAKPIFHTDRVEANALLLLLDGGIVGSKFLEDATYVVARGSDDEITVPDIGERAADLILAQVCR